MRNALVSCSCSIALMRVSSSSTESAISSMLLWICMPDACMCIISSCSARSARACAVFWGPVLTSGWGWGWGWFGCVRGGCGGASSGSGLCGSASSGSGLCGWLRRRRGWVW
eukprot:3934851-Rhodomonas_salina.1